MASKFTPSAPTLPIYAIGTILGILGILGAYVIPSLSAYSFEMLAIGFVLLLVGTSLKGL